MNVDLYVTQGITPTRVRDLYKEAELYWEEPVVEEVDEEMTEEVI